MRIPFWCCSVVLVLVSGCSNDDQPTIEEFTLHTIYAGSYEFDLSASAVNDQVVIGNPLVLQFSSPVDPGTAPGSISIQSNGSSLPMTFSFQEGNHEVVIAPVPSLAAAQSYTLVIEASLKNANGQHIQPVSISFQTISNSLTLVRAEVDGENLLTTPFKDNVAQNPVIELEFSSSITTTDVQNHVRLHSFNTNVPIVVEVVDGKKLFITPTNLLTHFHRYELVISGNITGSQGETFAPISRLLYTAPDPTPKFPVVSDEELLTIVQQQTFKYFYDFAHPASGMARERNTSGNLVTSGGSGFGLMALIVGIERNFITRAQGVDRLDRILTFLESADRFHGAWSHWIDGNTGRVIPFSANDNGGDLVETSLLVQGLLTFRQYLNASVPAEQVLINRINALWQSVEWDWYRRDGQNVLYWHWSPDKGWAMNLQIRGWNECLITYVLAAASPTHTIPATVYHNGWARNGDMRNNNMYYSIQLPLGSPYGGPLFFAHYSFLGIDPRNLSDTYANYWQQNVNHTLINRAYCIDNPRNYIGYSSDSWGLTASDNHQGYSAHSPTNDLGVITPTAALSSFPFTPEESMQALKFFYYTLGDRLWGEYGFYDAFNPTQAWFANSYLAIDQGPIIVMIENHRSGLLWNLFMSAPEIQAGLDKLNFSY